LLSTCILGWLESPLSVFADWAVEVVPVGDAEDAEEDHRVDDEEQAIADGEVGDAGGDKSDGEAEVGELADFRGDAGKQEGEDAEELGGGELEFEILG